MSSREILPNPEMLSVELVAGGNEASDLLPVRSAALLAAYGWRHGFWTVLDEGPADQSIALIGAPEGCDGWEARLLNADAGADNGRTEDGEALAHHDGWVYVVGSHFGNKRGPMRPKRAFFARFREADAVAAPVTMAVVRDQFRLHRVINDALAEAEAEVRPAPPSDGVHQRFIVDTLDRGTTNAKRWVERIRHGDHPLNIEAAAFTPTGTLLVGLRFPVTAEGQPILVELAGVASMFDTPRSWPSVIGVSWLSGVNQPGEPCGFRALSARPDGGFDAVVGSIDALGKNAVVLEDHPQGGDGYCRHVRFTLPENRSGHLVHADVIAELAPLRNVEGIAEVSGRRYYITDDDSRITLWYS